MVLAKQYEEQNRIVYPPASADAAVDGRRANVNGAQVLKDGEHTGARPGKALWGPGKIK
jgi:hypothetical protein